MKTNKLIQHIEQQQTTKISSTDFNVLSNSQRYKMLGNGWTVDVISHIFNHIKINSVVPGQAKANAQALLEANIKQTQKLKTA